MTTVTIVDLEAHLSDAFSQATVDSVAGATGLQATVLTKDDDLSVLKDAERVFVTGSADMLGDAEWAPSVAASIAAAAEAGVPTLAVCFGHQMMAKHYGGTIGSFEAIRKGIVPIRFAATGPFEGHADLIHTHRDHVIEAGALMPAGGGGFGGIAATRHPTAPLWTCQGHPEWNAALCKLDGAPEWKGLDAKKLDRSGLDIMERFATLARSG